MRRTLGAMVLRPLLLLTVACSSDDTADGGTTTTAWTASWIGTCFDEVPNASEVFENREGDSCQPSSARIFAVVAVNDGVWPGEDSERLTDDEAFRFADDTIVACRQAFEERSSGDDAQVLAYAPSDRSDFDRMEGTSLCLTRPRTASNVP